MERRTFTTAAGAGGIELLEYRSGSRYVNSPCVRPIDGQERIQEVGTMGISRDGVTGQPVLKVSLAWALTSGCLFVKVSIGASYA